MPDSCMCAECAPIPLTVCECQECERKRQTETVRIAKDGCTGQPSCACEICRWAARVEGVDRSEFLATEGDWERFQRDSLAQRLKIREGLAPGFSQDFDGRWSDRMAERTTVQQRGEVMALDPLIAYHERVVREHAAALASLQAPTGLWTRFRRWLAQDLIDRAETDAFLRGLARGQQQRED